VGPVNRSDAALTPFDATIAVAGLDLATTGFLDPFDELLGMLSGGVASGRRGRGQRVPFLVQGMTSDPQFIPDVSGVVIRTLMEQLGMKRNPARILRRAMTGFGGQAAQHRAVAGLSARFAFAGLVRGMRQLDRGSQQGAAGSHRLPQ
jgi:hypothetical protein